MLHVKYKLQFRYLKKYVFRTYLFLHLRNSFYAKWPAVALEGYCSYGETDAILLASGHRVTATFQTAQSSP